MEIPQVDMNDAIEVIANAEVAAQVDIIVKKNRFLPNGKYDKTPNSPTYFRDYYRSHRVPTECQYCHLIFTRVETVCISMVREAKNVSN